MGQKRSIPTPSEARKPRKVLLALLVPGILVLLQLGSSFAGQTMIAPLRATEKPINLKRFMGSWHVVGHIPVRLVKEHIATNAVETYTWNEATQEIGVHYRFNEHTLDGKINDSYQRGWVHNKETNTEWRVSPKLPLLGYALSGFLKLPYIIVDCASDYSTTIIGYPNRDYLWILSRSVLQDSEYYALVQKAVDMGYDESLIRRVPHDPSATIFPVPEL